MQSTGLQGLLPPCDLYICISLHPLTSAESSSSMNSDKKPPITICHGPGCRDYGRPELLARLKQPGADAERLCLYAPVVHMHNHRIPEASL